MSPEVSVDEVKSSWEAIGRLYDRSIESRVRCADRTCLCWHQACLACIACDALQIPQCTHYASQNTAPRLIVKQTFLLGLPADQVGLTVDMAWLPADAAGRGRGGRVQQARICGQAGPGGCAGLLLAGCRGGAVLAGCAAKALRSACRHLLKEFGVVGAGT